MWSCASVCVGQCGGTTPVKSFVENVVWGIDGILNIRLLSILRILLIIQSLVTDKIC